MKKTFDFDDRAAAVVMVTMLRDDTGLGLGVNTHTFDLTNCADNFTQKVNGNFSCADITWEETDNDILSKGSC